MRLNHCILASAIIMASCTSGPRDNDGNRFETVKIGSGEWMAENLDVTRFRNGDLIPEAKSAGDWVLYGKEHKPAWCFQNDPQDGKSYGRLYNWYAVNDPRGLAPAGWHIPTDDEWKQLTDDLGGETAAALRIRSSGLTGNGFRAIAAGSCNKNGFQGGYGSFACWWTSTELTGSEAWMRLLSYTSASINALAYDKTYGLSVRCIKDTR